MREFYDIEMQKSTDPMYRAELMTTGGVSREETRAGAAVEAAYHSFIQSQPHQPHCQCRNYDMIL
jgi:hypothetical protein